MIIDLCSCLVLKDVEMVGNWLSAADDGSLVTAIISCSRESCLVFLKNFFIICF